MKINSVKTLSAFILAGAAGLSVQAQVQVIDPLTGGLGGYTTTAVLDNSLGAGSGVSFTSSGSGLQANYVGSVAAPEQSLFLSLVSSFSSPFVVGDRLSVNVSVPASSTQMDFGLAIAATATPTAAGAGNSYNSRTTFDWASISIRPSQTAIRANSSISGTLVTANGVINGVNPTTVSQLYIDWVSADVFTLGYIDTSSIGHVSETITFAPSSTIGTAIGFYGDLRATGASLGNFTSLTIQPVPEPSTLVLGGMSLAGLIAVIRRKK